MVGLVEHQHFGGPELGAAGRHMVEQTAGCGDQHFQAARQHFDLRALRDAADDHADFERGLQELAVGLETVGDLRREFAGRSEHQSADMAGLDAAAVGEDAVENRQRESGRLAGAGLRDAEQIAALHQIGNGLGLDGGWSFITLVLESAKERLGQAEIGKCRHLTSFMCESAASSSENAFTGGPKGVIRRAYRAMTISCGEESRLVSLSFRTDYAAGAPRVALQQRSHRAPPVRSQLV